ncbi:MAG: hypothetical protein QXI58_04455 [Candidatus Micrarchaeia archaeon]
MSEEKPSEPVEFILVSFAFIIFCILLAKIIIDSINIFVYFFAKASPEQMSETISGLVTISAGTPGNVKINFAKPKDYDYNVYFKDRMVFVEIYDYQKPIAVIDEEMKYLLNKSHSSSAVYFTARNFFDFDILVIQKEQTIKIDKIGGLN